MTSITLISNFHRVLNLVWVEGSETSANHNRTPGKYPKEYIQVSPVYSAEKESSPSQISRCMQGRKSCGMIADNEGHGLTSTVNIKAHPTSHAAVVAGSMWRSNGTAAVKCQMFVSLIKLNNKKRMHC